MHEIITQNKLLRKYENHFEFIYQGKDNNTSSSYIREEFEFGRNPRYYMLPEVYKYIIENNLYRNES
jgi:nicotinic acid mononucleotide adenylyltransferase